RIEGPLHGRTDSILTLRSRASNLKWLPLVVGRLEHKSQVLTSGNRLYVQRRGTVWTRHHEMRVRTRTLHCAVNQILASGGWSQPQHQRTLRALEVDVSGWAPSRIVQSGFDKLWADEYQHTSVDGKG